MQIAYDELQECDNEKALGAKCVAHILEISEKMGFKGNLWKDYIAYEIAVNENAFSLSCERKGKTEGSINKAALYDCGILRKIFNADLLATDDKLGTNFSLLMDFENNNEDERYFNKRIRNRIILLAKELPKTWKIKSCLSCRFGHFCPVGNGDNELFCVTDFAPKEPRDLWHVTENEIERKNRSRTLFDCCDHYKEQAEDYFTYSDYYYEVKK